LKFYRAQLAEAGTPWASRLSQLYPATTDDEAQDALVKYVTDRDFACPARYVAAKRTAPTWLYRVSARPAPEGSGAYLGAYHGSDVRFLFHADLGVPLGEAGERVGDAMRRFWARFAATGNPDGAELPAWPVYASSRERMEFGETIRSVSALDTPGCEVFDAIN